MAPHRRAALISAFVAFDAVILAVLVTPWALVVVPFALVFGLASWRGVSPAKTLDALGDSSNDPGSGPAGLTP